MIKLQVTNTTLGETFIFLATRPQAKKIYMCVWGYIEIPGQGSRSDFYLIFFFKIPKKHQKRLQEGGVAIYIAFSEKGYKKETVVNSIRFIIFLLQAVNRFVLYAVSGLPEEQIYTLECRNSIKLFFDDEKEKKVSSRGILDKKVRVGRVTPNTHIFFWPK